MTSLLTGLALCFPLHRFNSPSLDALPRRPAIASPSPPPLTPPFPTTCTFSVAIPHRAYIDAPMRTLTRTFTQPRIEHRLPALTGRVQRSLDRTVSLYLTPVDPRGLPPPSLSFPPCLSLLHVRSRTEYRHVSRTPRRYRHFVSRSVSSCLSSFPSVLLPSFSPTYRFLLFLCSPFLPAALSSPHVPSSVATLVPRRSPLSLSLSLSLFLRFPHRRRCRAQRSRAAMRTTQMHASDCTTLDVNGLAREKKSAPIGM